MQPRTLFVFFFIIVLFAVAAPRADAASLKFYGGKMSNNGSLDSEDCPPFPTCVFLNISGQLVTNPQDLLPKLNSTGGITQPPKPPQLANKSYKVFKTGLLVGPCSPGKSILGYGGTWGNYIVNIFGYCG